MKKYFLALGLSLLLLGSSGLAEAKETKWSLLGENPSGSYYTDLKAFKMPAKDPGTIQASARAVFKNASFVRLLNEQYGNKVRALDSAAECIMKVILQPKANAYRIEEIELLSKKGKVLDKKKVKEDFSPIPEKTFIESLAREAAAWQVEQGSSLKKKKVQPVRKKMPRHPGLASQKKSGTTRHKAVPKKEGTKHV